MNEQSDDRGLGLSPRSRLYRLEIAGGGTGAIEALTSYVMRLATAHLHLVGTIVTQVLGPSLVVSRSTRRAAVTELIPNARTANGNDAEARSWAEAIANATLIEAVPAMTMLRWSPVLPSRGVLVKTVRHCPSCLAEMADRGVVYEPLAWMLSMSTICVPHDRLLRATCLGCDSPQPVLTRSSRPGMCRTCDEWLGGQQAERAADAPTEWDRFTSAAVLDLIGPVANEEGAPDLSLVGPAIRTASLARGASQNGFARRIGVVPATLSEISNHEIRPSLETVLRICAVGGWSPAALLQGRLTEAFAPLDDIPAPEGRRPIDWSMVDCELGTAIGREGEPEASATIAQRLGIDIGLLRDKRPDQIAILVEKRRSWIARGKAARLDDAIATVEAITRQIILTGGTASRREVETYLPAPLQLRERPLQEAWRRARAS